MKKSAYLVAAACVAGLVGCAHQRDSNKITVRNVVDVTVENDQIVVNPPIIVVGPGQRDVVVTWVLPEGRNLTFPEDGIVIEGQVQFPKETVPDDARSKDSRFLFKLDPQNKGGFKCGRAPDRKELVFRCTSAKPEIGIYSYTVRVVLSGKKLKRDPELVVM